jgi:hypothetical protein
MGRREPKFHYRGCDLGIGIWSLGLLEFRNGIRMWNRMVLNLEKELGFDFGAMTVGE